MTEVTPPGDCREGIAFKSELDVGDDIGKGGCGCCCRTIRETWCR